MRKIGWLFLALVAVGCSATNQDQASPPSSVAGQSEHDAQVLNSLLAPGLGEDECFARLKIERSADQIHFAGLEGMNRFTIICLSPLFPARGVRLVFCDQEGVDSHMRYARLEKWSLESSTDWRAGSVSCFP